MVSPHHILVLARVRTLVRTRTYLQVFDEQHAAFVERLPVAGRQRDRLWRRLPEQTRHGDGPAGGDDSGEGGDDGSAVEQSVSARDTTVGRRRLTSQRVSMGQRWRSEVHWLTDTGSVVL